MTNDSCGQLGRVDAHKTVWYIPHSEMESDAAPF